ncbi:hypothetical protein [Corynebacterium pseudotuberculosis]|uniref:hypothetical protein n=1 Tax=Corynebacterium pseudotuberculosis TaxID=1719 RepID=UPI00090C3474|nr:hypothetical protein [Corynebacterium pseudotuberculosis]APG82367.1 Hypothetical protein CPI37_1737 [Corynebacterium pseudotuberculosis]ARX64300.1 Hypothetical protein Cp262_2198 [Corynebacterium pseudotuberculosis]ASA48328.1 hypothetical protein CP162_08575 [Corynebacterium pseudotuberculosis Cp162]
MIEIVNRQLVDADALAIMDSVWNQLPNDLRAYAASSCDDDEDVSAVIAILDYALATGLSVSKAALSKARSLAEKLSRDVDARRILELAAGLNEAGTKAA